MSIVRPMLGRTFCYIILTKCRAKTTISCGLHTRKSTANGGVSNNHCFGKTVVICAFFTIICLESYLLGREFRMVSKKKVQGNIENQQSAIDSLKN